MSVKPSYEELEQEVKILQKKNDILVESEANLISLLENSPDYFAILDKDFVIRFVNRSLPRLTKDEVIGRSYFDLLSPEDHAVWKECLESVFKTGKPATYAAGYEVSEGVFRDFESRIGPVIHQGRVDGIVLSATDITERSQAEQELRKSEEKYRSLFDNAADLIALIDREGNLVDLNKQFETESGYAREDMIGKNAFTIGILSETSVTKVQTLLPQALAGQQPSTFELEGLTKDGKMVPFEVRAVPIEKNGEIVAIQATLRNITNRKKAEKTIRESEEKLKMIFENANDEILFVDTKGVTIDVNDKVYDIFGYTREEVLGKNFAEFNFLADEELEKMVSLFEDVIAGKEVPMQEFEGFRKDGTKVFVEGNSRVVKKDGEIIGILNIIRNITDRKRAEKELRKSEEKFKTIFDNANDVILYLSEDGTFVEINDKVEETFGYTREEVIGKNFMEFDFLTPDDMKKMAVLFNEVVAGKVTPMQEFVAFRKDRGKVVIEGNSRLIKKDGEVIGLLNILRDITARKQVEEALKKREEELEIKTETLEDTNTALNVLLKKRDEEKKELEEKVLVNVKELIMPFFGELKNTKLNERQKGYVDTIESNINEIISPFIKRLSSKYTSLTPTEIRIANMIKQGKSTKDIADLLKMHARTIDIHRYNIRKKLGINNTKANLTTYLLTYEQ